MNLIMAPTNIQALPFISIIIPAFNEEKNICFCLSGIWKLDYPKEKIEIIVVDNGSMDGTVVVAQKYGAKIFSAPNISIAALRNLGWRNSKGEYVAFLDADCIPNKNWLKRSIENFNTLSGAVAVSGVLVLDVHSSARHSWIERLWIDYLRSKYTKKITISKTLSSFCFIVPRKYFDLLGGFNETLITCEDSDLGYRLSKIGKIFIDTDIQVIHLGNAKTIKDFFLRQLWHGSSNWSNLRSHKITLDEIPSVLVPFLFCSFPIMAIALSLFGFQKYAPILWGMFFCLPFGITLGKKTGRRGIGQFSGYYVIWFMYLLARGCALYLPSIGRIKKRGK
jgi:glycosyltransferase involved in cell wall biosynthesis